MKIIVASVAALLFAASCVWAHDESQGNPPQAASAGITSVQPSAGNTQPSGPDAWRYRWCNGRWWYWLPENRWTYWENDRWVDYSPSSAPSTFAGGAPMGPAAGDTSYYQPYTSYYQPESSYYQPYTGGYQSYGGYGSSGSRSDYGPGWGWGHGWNGQGHSWRSGR